ncbi:MAG: hypothetical protein HY718_11825 [Planctomycetes bacterium]|nr:hypothetical protein [Planctomycetota bacterium]
MADLAIRLVGGRADRDDARRRAERLSYRTDAAGLGLRMTTFLRDRLRGRWLRIRRGD